MNPSQLDVCIIGAGISGLGVAAFLRAQDPGLQVLILEQADRPGGAIRTYRHGDYLAEWGPHGFLDNCDESRTLISLAGLEQEVVRAPLGTFVRYICRAGQLRCIPQQPARIIRAPLIPLSAKLRVLADLWKAPLSGDPTVAEWTAYRFGKALLPFADAVFTGTYAGDISRLRIDGVMAGVRELEKLHGSVIRGIFRKLRASADKSGKKKVLPAMTSFRDGMERLPEALADRVLQDGTCIRYGDGAVSIRREKNGWRVFTAQNEAACRHLVLALPINRSLPLLAAALPATPPPLSEIPEARIASVLLGFKKNAVIPAGFGYLAPEEEQRFTLGALFSSHMFPQRSPEGQPFMEALVGGRRHPERLELDDDRMIKEVYDDLRQLMALPEPPCFTTVLRSEAGIPQFEEGYTTLLAWRQQLQETDTTLHLCGFGWKGIGINDMTKEARKIASRIGTAGRIPEASEIKGIYF